VSLPACADLALARAWPIHPLLLEHKHNLFPKENSIWTLKELSLLYALQHGRIIFVANHLNLRHDYAVAARSALLVLCRLRRGDELLLSCFSAACKVAGFEDNLGRQHEDKAPLLALLFTPWGEGITRSGE